MLATVPSVAPLKPSEYAFWLYHFWQLPANGLLMLIALKERRIESEVGLAWEPFLGDVETGEALQAAVPMLKEGRYAEGLLTVLQVIEQHYQARREARQGGFCIKVDFVLSIGEHRIPVEVKYRHRIDPHRDTFGLRAFIEKTIHNAPFGVLITQHDEVEVLDPRIVACHFHPCC